ncbi:MAG: 4Fe-4S binding protein, partial [Bacteroidota bacterium]
VFILLAIVGVSLLLKKAFCSWMCPVGTLSEALWMLGEYIFGRTLRIPRWLDYPLRSLKYLLLLFFVYAIWEMDVSALKQFLYSPYNRVADIKMYLFFANITAFVFWTIVILMLLSVAIRNFWCRFLCPYGALLGIAGWLSPLKITRKKETCIDCELCSKACPSMINVHKAGSVWSDECMACLRCVDACPVVDTLEMKTSVRAERVPGWVFGILVAGVFVAITGLGMLTGNWQNAMSQEEYVRRFENLHSPVYQHHHGTVPEYGPND